MSKRSLLVLALCPTIFACTPEDDDGDGLELGDDLGETGDGDGDPTTGDGDGDPTTGDGDGDPTGDGDGDPTTGDGDGDPTTGDGDGDGDGDTSACIAPDPGWAGTAQVGQPAPHFAGINQFGDSVSICEYEGAPMVIDTSAVWCGPCQMMSACLGGDNAACMQLFGQNVDFLMVPLRAAVNDGSFAWVTVLEQNVNGGPPSMADAQAWDANFPAENVWVIPDVGQQYQNYFNVLLVGFPSIWLMDEQMNWKDLDQMTVFGSIQMSLQ